MNENDFKVHSSYSIILKSREKNKMDLGDKTEGTAER
jgi:hypothetical protein